jgi:hypothetical protein
MSNMSYCRFQNTSSDLRDCLDVMRGEDYEYYPNKKKLSSEERDAMYDIIEMAREIVEIADDPTGFMDDDYNDTE